MIRISALNDSSDDDESQSLSKSRATTKEAQESAALALYNRALSLLRQGDEEGARATFCQLLDAPFVRDAEPPEENEPLVEPGLVLKYSTYKNLGSMSAQKEDYNTAMKYYLEAVNVDSSDVTVWYKIGSIALKLHHYPLARHSFEQGLECQPRHWPCLDNVITVLYALNNYEACLTYIARALQRDPGYVKGICFMEKIFDEQPTLKEHTKSYFASCDQSIFTIEVDQEEADEFVDEALEMRARKEALCRRRERPVLEFTLPFTAFTWMNLATCLISLYDHIASSKPPITYSCRVDLSAYKSKEALKALLPPTPPPLPPVPVEEDRGEDQKDRSPVKPGTPEKVSGANESERKEEKNQDGNISKATSNESGCKEESDEKLPTLDSSKEETSKTEIPDSSEERPMDTGAMEPEGRQHTHDAAKEQKKDSMIDRIAPKLEETSSASLEEEVAMHTSKPEESYSGRIEERAKPSLEQPRVEAEESADKAPAASPADDSAPDSLPEAEPMEIADEEAPVPVCAEPDVRTVTAQKAAQNSQDKEEEDVSGKVALNEDEISVKPTESNPEIPVPSHEVDMVEAIEQASQDDDDDDTSAKETNTVKHQDDSAKQLPAAEDKFVVSPVLGDSPSIIEASEEKLVAGNEDNKVSDRQAIMTGDGETSLVTEAPVREKPSTSVAHVSERVSPTEVSKSTGSSQAANVEAPNVEASNIEAQSTDVSTIEASAATEITTVDKPFDTVCEKESPMVTDETGDKTEQQQTTNDMSMTGDTTIEGDQSMSASDPSVIKEPAKRGPKRKRERFNVADIEKRRSSRVRNTAGTSTTVVKPAENDVKIRDLVVSLLPTSLTEVRGENMEIENQQPESAMGMTSQEKDVASDNVAIVEMLSDRADLPTMSTTEEEDVLDFILNHQNNSGIIDLLNELLIALAQRALALWPVKLTSSYVEAYSRVHKHLIMPGYLCKDEPIERIRNMGKMILVHAELKIDQWINTRSRSSPSSRMSSSKDVAKLAEHAFLTDVAYLDGLSQCQDIFGEEWADFIIRVYWMKARFSMLESDMEGAQCSFDLTNAYLEYLEKEKSRTEILLPHVKHDNKVTQDNIKRQLESLQRCQSQDKLRELRDSGEHEKVIKLLLETFDTNTTGPKMIEIEQQERHAQLLLLMETLLKIKDYKRAIIWGEVSLNQALKKYYTSQNDSMRNEWVNTVIQLLHSVFKCVSEDPTIVTNLTSRCLVRLTQNVMTIIEMAVDVPESASDMAISTMLPWMLLYKLIHYEEVRSQPVLTSAEENQDKSFTFAHEGSIKLLELVHEQLGRRSWCCNHEGSLLLFIVNEVLDEIKRAEQLGLEHPHQKVFDPLLEQCFHCLYGHPNRKKAKHLLDHSSSQISLTWERSVSVFEFFKPKTVPEYDSIKMSSVSAELEIMLRKIDIMIPTDLQLPIKVDDITNYIEGTSNTPPTMPDDTQLPENDMLVLCELYYLLADFYFKNKEQGKAIKFYMQDLCVNPLRFDSWAGMALARASRLEQKLSMSELKSSEGKNEGSIWKYAVASLRSFERALEIDCTNSKLWIEYGCLAYQLHAHASRQLKQQSLYPLTDQSLDDAKKNREDMLNIAEKCYKKASEAAEVDESEEEWLHHYMLGKVAEKKGSHPGEYLKHYKLALMYLHNDRARYPRKITYIYNPPHLAVETLEVFYRLHASIMKYLLRYPEDAPYAMFDAYTQEAADGPFANAREKGKAPKDRDVVADDSSNSDFTPPTPSVSNPTFPSTSAASAPSKKKPPHSTRMDHTYSKQRSVDSAKSEADSSGDVTIMKEGFGAETLKDTNIDDQSKDKPYEEPVIIGTISDTGTSEPGEGDKREICTPIGDTPMADKKTDGKKMDITASESMSKELFHTPLATSFSRAASDEASFSMPVAVSTLENDSLPRPSTPVKSPVPMESKEDAVETSPNATYFDNIDASMEVEEASADRDESNQQPSSTSELVSPNTNQSMSQESLQPRGDSVERFEEMEVSIESALEKTDAGDVPTGQDSKLDFIESSKSSEVGEASSSSYLEKNAAVKSETDPPIEVKTETDDRSKTSLLDVDMGQQATDSSQDSATAAALEHLKSEISFLNAGSSELASVFIVDSDDDKESVKDTKESSMSQSESAPIKVEIKVEPEEENKEEEEREQNEALEALKTELAKLSAAAGIEPTPNYEAQMVKGEVDSAENSSQEFPAVTPEPAAEPDKTTEAKQGKEREKEEDQVAIKDSFKIDESKSESSEEIKPKETGAEERPLGQLETETQKEQSEAQQVDEAGNIEDKSKAEEDKAGAMDSPSPVSTEKREGAVSTSSDDAGVQKDEKGESGTAPEAANASGTSSSESSLDDNDIMETAEAKKSDQVNEKEKTTDEQTTKDKEKEKTAEDKVNEEKDKTTEKSVKPASESPGKNKEEQKELFKKIMTRCMKALSLCLSRFPHHYKSLYRLAYLYRYCEEFKNLTYARDLLLGNVNWAHLEHMKSPGLFQERKNTNFFQGLWRIPVEEIDRSGSFACHMLRSLQLLFPVLMGLKDSKMLFSIHLMLSRTPDQGRKYLRDSDRLELARLALVNCLEILDQLIDEKTKRDDRQDRIDFLLEIFRVWQHCVAKANQMAHSRPVNKLLRKAYFSCMKDEIKEEPSVLEQAIRFCQQEQQMAAKSPTTPDPGLRASLPSTPTTKRGYPFEGYSVPTKTAESQDEASVASTSNPLKGITPLSMQRSAESNPKAYNKVVKSCSVRLTSPGRPRYASPGRPRLNTPGRPRLSPGRPRLAGPGRPRLSPGRPRLNSPGRPRLSSITSGIRRPSPSTVSQIQKALKSGEGAKKLTISNVLKKAETMLSTATTASASLSTSTTTSASTSSTPTTPFSIFQPGGLAALSGMNAAALYAQMAQMSPEMLMAQYGAAYTPEMILQMQQMQLASLGIPIAAMPYMYNQQGSIDPTLWKSLATMYGIGGAEASSSSKSTSPRPSSTVKSAASGKSSATATTASTSSSQKFKSAHKAQSAAGSSSEPPKKMVKITPVTWSQSQKSTTTTPSAPSAMKRENQPLALTKPLSLTTTTTVSSSTGGRIGQQQQHPPSTHTKLQSAIPTSGLKVSAKTSQLYAVRMPSALAKVTQKASQSSTSSITSQSAQQRPEGQPPPAKMAKKVDALPTSLATASSGANLDSLALLATVAQSHKLSSPLTAKPASTAVRAAPTQHRTQASTPVAQPPRSIKGPPTLKRSKIGGHTVKHVQQAKASPAHPQVTPKAGAATAAGTSHLPSSLPMNLSTQRPSPQQVLSKPGPASSKIAKPAGSLLAQHLTSSASRTPTTATTAGKQAVKLVTIPVGPSKATPSSQRMAMPMARTPTSLLKPVTTTVSRPQQAAKAPAVVGSQAKPQVAPSSQSKVPSSLVSQGYGRGKPSYPATLASRQQSNEDSSDDCIILSSGQDSESD